jgi:EmrB/QacA subfamily drug resistance transporter
MSTPNTAVGNTASASRALIMFVLGCCFLVVMMDNTILNVALQTVQEDLKASNSDLQWALDAYILFYAALMFSAGVLADVFGRRKMLLIGLLVFGVASAFAAFAHSPEQLIVWRAVMGVGGSVVPPATLAILGEIFRRQERAKAIGIWSALGGLSIALGPIIGGFLLAHFWWGSVFLINVPVVVICAVLMLRVVPESRAAHRPHIDLPGVALSVAGIGAVVYGVIRGGDTSDWTGAEVLGTIGGGVVLLALFVLFEQRQHEPALDVRLLTNKAFAAGSASLAFSFFAVTGGTFLMVFYVQGVRGDSPLQLGYILLPVAFGTVIAATRSSTLARRFGPRAVVVAGLLLLALSFAGQAFFNAGTALWLYEVDIALSGAGLGLVMATSTTTTMAVVDPEKAGIGAGVNNALRQFGAALGVAVIGSVLATRYKDNLGNAVQVLPTPLNHTAADSLGSTLIVVRQLNQTPGVPADVRSGLPGLVVEAQHAYVDAMHVGFEVAAAVLFATVLICAAWLPGRTPVDRAADPAADAGAEARDLAVDGPGVHQHSAAS